MPAKRRRDAPRKTSRTPRRAQAASRPEPSGGRGAEQLPPAPAGDELRGLVEDLALLTAANNLMAQTAFLTVERMRISSEVVDEAVTNEFGAQLFQRCEDLVRASDEAIERVLDRLGPEGERAALVRSLLAMRREFAGPARRPAEQPRLVESLERMYR